MNGRKKKASLFFVDSGSGDGEPDSCLYPEYDSEFPDPMKGIEYVFPKTEEPFMASGSSHPWLSKHFSGGTCPDGSVPERSFSYPDSS